MPEIKAIETVYRGHRFRSRLEARWAVFFDAARIRWEYESEGYILTDGTNYLPDFTLYDVKTYFVPTQEVLPQEMLPQDVLPPHGLLIVNPLFFVEVKPTKDQAGDAIDRLVSTFSQSMIFLIGDPYSGGVVWMGNGGEGHRIISASAWVDCGSGIGLLWPWPPSTSMVETVKNNPAVSRGFYSPSAISAKLAARQARFEHGESGAPRISQSQTK